MRHHLHRRLDRLSAQLPPKPLPPLPAVDPEWQELARRDPEARAHAVALTQRWRELFPGGEFSTSHLYGDDIACRHLLWLQAALHGGLDGFFITDEHD